jgi:hypothetical protein
MAKANMSLTRNAMPVQDAKVRAHNFDEVALGYTEEQAIDEANRCLNCKNMPCVAGCPVKIHIPEFITKIKEGDFEGAYQIITKSSSLPAVCGRVCPQETQCESKCVRGIKGESVGIGRLERFVADWHNTFCTEEPVKPESNGHRVAIVGSGPSGLTCAGDLAKKGYKVTVFEALHAAGGVLVYGIPEFRLPKAIVKKEVDNLVAMGVSIYSLATALQKAKGKMLPLGWWHLLKALFVKPPKRLDFLLVAVKPEYQGQGAFALIFNEMLGNFMKLGIVDVESNPELENNTKMQTQWNEFEKEQHKRRRAFKKEL